MSQSLSAAPRKDPRGRRRPVGYDRAATLKPIDLEAHTQLLDAHRMMSGRCRGYVYWWRKGKLHWRRHVVPRDPRTPTQLLSRAAFGAASKAWSENQPLTQDQRDAWRAEAAKIKTRPRLAQSGLRNAQQHFVGRNSVKERWGLPLLLEPRTEGRQNAECRSQATRVPIQVKHCQTLTRASSERPHTSSRPLPVHRLCQARSSSPLRSIGWPRASSTFPDMRRRAHFRELWRGG
jgi:hypothetical protein